MRSYIAFIHQGKSLILYCKVKQEIEFMLQQAGVSSRVTVPTTWCSGLLPVSKLKGKVRLCIGLTQLNKAVERELNLFDAIS